METRFLPWNDGENDLLRRKEQMEKNVETGSSGKGKVKVHICRIYGKRQRAFDKDNLYSGIKPVLDALKEEGVIHDDNPGEIDLTVEQRRGADKERLGTEITVVYPDCLRQDKRVR